MSDAMLTVTEAANFLRIAKQTMAQWRTNKTGPPYHKIGGKVIYSFRDLNEWVESRRRETRG